MRLNEIVDNAGAKKKSKRVGRGIGSGKGKTSGKGHKGQNSRSGVSLVGFEGGQMPLYRRLPKRGFNNIFSKQYAELNLGSIQIAIDSGKIDEEVFLSQELLINSGLVQRKKHGIKLLANGIFTKKIEIEVTKASVKATSIVKEYGGNVTLREENINRDRSEKKVDKNK